MLSHVKLGVAGFMGREGADVCACIVLFPYHTAQTGLIQYVLARPRSCHRGKGRNDLHLLLLWWSHPILQACSLCLRIPVMFVDPVDVRRILKLDETNSVGRAAQERHVTKFIIRPPIKVNRRRPPGEPLVELSTQILLHEA